MSALCHCWCPPISTGHVAFLFICLPGPPFSADHAAFYSCVSQICHWWCPPFSAGRVAFLSICFPGLSLLVSALFRWPCSISIRFSPRSVTAGVRPFPLATQHFYSFVSQACHWRCPPFSVGHAASILLSPRSVTAAVRPVPLAMQHFYSFVSQVCHWWCPPFSAGNAAFYSLVSQVCHCWCPPFSVGHVAFLFICLPGLSLPVRSFPLAMQHFYYLPGLSLLVSALFRWPCSISIHVSPRPVTGGVRPFPLAM